MIDSMERVTEYGRHVDRRHSASLTIFPPGLEFRFLSGRPSLDFSATVGASGGGGSSSGCASRTT